MRPTLIVRQIMRKHNKIRVFTNLYDTCRTVKCYAKLNENVEMIDEIEKTLTEQGVAYSVKRINHIASGWGPYPSIIVRLPL